ncbi:hypothetical protein GWI33_015111 [Rhynchophorus ferrugineus]|uniref:Uncharacterized protein n=1 Tax=Rhynchophorus ferrugineus TaxID=354439 RepID=A0A834I1B3_RHYFE|nr:hypothetical protein GWI33_015111 [Rhynchophorus ferrugineus]
MRRAGKVVANPVTPLLPHPEECHDVSLWARDDPTYRTDVKRDGGSFRYPFPAINSIGRPHPPPEHPPCSFQLCGGEGRRREAETGRHGRGNIERER